MKKILLALFFAGSSLFANAHYGDSGSEIESHFMLKINLIKENNTTVQVLDGTKYLKINADGSTSGFGASLDAVRPADGIYIGLKYSLIKAKRKIKLIDQGTTYYSREFEKAGEEAYNLSQDENDYGFTMLTFGDNSTTLMFPKKLILKKGIDAGLYFISQFAPDKVLWESTGSVEASTTIREEEIFTAFLPYLPKKKISIDVIYTKSNKNNLTNTVILLLDNENDLIGGFLARPNNDIALGGNHMLSGDKANNNYDVKFKLADESATDNDYFNIEGTFDCSNSTYTDLNITQTINGILQNEIDLKHDNDQGGYTLITSGNITCKDINITE